MKRPETYLSYGHQWIDDADIAAVVDVLRSDFLTQGPAVETFEKRILEITGAKYCLAVSNATAGLHIALAALRLEAGSEGITSPITFVASSNAMLYNDVVPVFADIDAVTYNLDPKSAAAKITGKTRVLLPVHFAGRAADMEGFSKLAGKHGLRVIEDAAHAIGSAYADGSPVGNCRYSDATVFSFHPVKTVTTGEGGAVTTNDPELYNRLLLLRSHGITKDPSRLGQNPGPWYYEMTALGFNFRLCDIQAALGASQLRRLGEFADRRSRIIDRYNEAFRRVDWMVTPANGSGAKTCFHLYVVLVDFEKIGLTRKEVMERLSARNIGTQVHYIPVHTQPYYQKRFGYGWGDCPEAEGYYQKALSLPLFPKMTDGDVEWVIENVLALHHPAK